MSPAWKVRAGAWLLDERIVHLADPLPNTRDLVALALSQYSWRIIVGTMRERTDIGWLLEAILAEQLSTAILDEIADALVEQIFAQPRWVVERIWGQTLGMWRDIDGELGRHGVDLLALSPDRATNIAYAMLNEQHSHKDDGGRRWRAELEEVPARARKSAASEEAAAQDWFAMAGILGGGAPPMTTPALTGVDSELSIT